MSLIKQQQAKVHQSLKRKRWQIQKYQIQYFVLLHQNSINNNLLTTPVHHNPKLGRVHHDRGLLGWFIDKYIRK